MNFSTKSPTIFRFGEKNASPKYCYSNFHLHLIYVGCRYQCWNANQQRVIGEEKRIIKPASFLASACWTQKTERNHKIRKMRILYNVLVHNGNNDERIFRLECVSFWRIFFFFSTTQQSKWWVFLQNSYIFSIILLFPQTTILRMMDDPNGVINRRCQKKGDTKKIRSDQRFLLRRESAGDSLYTWRNQQ
jgi:hypothetical protein